MNNFGVCWLTRMFQVAWETGDVSKQWQTSVLIPIHKKGDKKKCTYYWGISLLSLSEKIHHGLDLCLQQIFEKSWKYATEVYT